MATHTIETKLVIHFDDGSTQIMPTPARVYYYREQKYNYWVLWLEDFMDTHPEITAKPVSIEEVQTVVECESYQIHIGV